MTETKGCIKSQLHLHKGWYNVNPVFEFIPYQLKDNTYQNKVGRALEIRVKIRDIKLFVKTVTSKIDLFVCARASGSP